MCQGMCPNSECLCPSFTMIEMCGWKVPVEQPKLWWFSGVVWKGPCSPRKGSRYVALIIRDIVWLMLYYRILSLPAGIAGNPHKRETALRQHFECIPQSNWPDGSLYSLTVCTIIQELHTTWRDVLQYKVLISASLQEVMLVIWFVY